MDRRSFLKSLVAIPFVGLLVPKRRCSGFTDGNGRMLYEGDRVVERNRRGKSFYYPPQCLGRDGKPMPDYWYARVVYGKHFRWDTHPVFGLEFENRFCDDSRFCKAGQHAYMELNDYTCKVGEPTVLVGTQPDFETSHRLYREAQNRNAELKGLS